MQRESKHFPSISRLHFGCFLALPLHPSPGLLSLKLFHFTNICWQRGIPNLSRAFSQISLLEQNADLTCCRCSRIFIILFFHSWLYFNGFMKKKIIQCPPYTKLLRFQFCAHKQILMASVIISLDCCPHRLPVTRNHFPWGGFIWD